MRHILTLFLLSILFSSQAQIRVTADRPTATYEAGELMNFEVVADAWGPIDYFIRFDTKTPILARGRIFANPGTPTRIPFTLEEPGGVICVIQNDTASASAGAIFSPYDLQPYTDEPADFDDFWDGVKAELATVPIDPILTPYTSSNLSETFRVNLGNINNRRVYGYISVPKGIDGPFPAILTMPAFGDIANIVNPDPVIAEWGGALSMTISIHNSEPDVSDPNAYQPNNIADRDSIYFKNAIAGAIRSIDYLFTRPDFNGEDLGVVGVSQGGGLALMTAGVDSRVKTLAQTVSALCGHAGHRFNKASGLPFYIQFSRAIDGSLAHEDATIDATSYYDGIFFARRFKGPSMTFISYADTISPATTVFTAYNQLQGNNILMHSKDLGHDNPEEFWTMRFEFWRRYFPAMFNAPFQWAPTTTGYGINVGSDISIPSGGTADLAATLDYNGAPLNDLKARWIKVEGPGRVSFSNVDAYNTIATFTEDGEYLIRFIARDESTLDSEGEFYTIGDFVKVTVGN